MTVETKSLLAVFLFIGSSAVAHQSVSQDAALGGEDQDEKGVTLLMRAARDGELGDVKWQLKYKADVNARDAVGWTALVYAAAKGDIEIVKALLAQGASVNSKDGDYAPLMAAVEFHHVSVVRLLIEKGADVNQQSRTGETAISDALRTHHQKMVDILKKAGAIAPAEQEKSAEPTVPPSPDDALPLLLNVPQPVYTERARVERIEGTVYARVLVGSDGKVKRVRIQSGLPAGLSYQARAAAYQMIFKPARKGGQAVAFWIPMEVEFNLRRR